MGYQRNKNFYVSQREHLQINDKGKTSGEKNRKTQKVLKTSK